jgi:hypothetical protein
MPASKRLQVTCSSKRPFGGERHITGIGGVDGGTAWGLSREEAADEILKGERTFFVTRAGGREVEVDAVQGGYWAGHKTFFVQTRADFDPSDNLLQLPDCAPGAYSVEVWY